MGKIRFFWNREKRPVNSDEILINGKLIVFIVCSFVSLLINLIFITNLTRSPYTIGTLLSIPAAVLLGILSLALDASKVFHAIQVNTLNELIRKLNKDKSAKKVKSVKNKWFAMYILYVVLSIVTSVSLSSISIGAGISRNANTLKQIDEFIVQGEQYVGIDSTAKNITTQNLINKATDTSESDANIFAQKQIDLIRPVVEEYKDERNEFISAGYSVSSTEEIEWQGKKIIPDTYWDKRNNDVNKLLTSAGYTKQSGKTIMALNLATVQNTIRANYLKSHSSASNDTATEKLNSLSKDTMEEAYGWIETLNNIGLVNPKTNSTVQFDTDKSKSTKVLVSSALTQLKALRVDVENDSGDIGSSSKIFMQIGSLVENSKNKLNSTDFEDAMNKKSGSFGTTEVMMMLMLLFLSLLCEIAINQFSPRTKITQKTVGQFRQYFSSNFDINDFMLDIIIEQYNYGEITKEEFDKQKDEILRMTDVNKKALIDEYKAKKNAIIIPVNKTAKELVEESKKKTVKKAAPKKKSIKVEPKEETVKLEVETPKMEVIEAPKEDHKLIVKSAEKELREMIGE